MNSQADLILNELYLARRTAVELVRDSSPFVIERLNNAFLNEVSIIILRTGTDPAKEVRRLLESSEEETARLLTKYLGLDD